MRTFAAFGALAMLAAGPSWAAPSLLEIQGSALEHALARHSIPAMAAVVIRDGRAETEVVRGTRSPKPSDDIRVGELWAIGSDTKAMTATLIGRLVDAGKLKWSARLADLLPDLAADMQPAYRGATLADLLSHFAGLPEAQSQTLTDEAYVQSIFSDRRPLPEQRIDYIRKCLSDPPIAPPRAKHSYSNTGFIIAAVIAERVGRKPFEQMMEAQVFQPLGMRSATFALPAAGDLTGHTRGRAAAPQDANPSIFNGAGQLRVTMGDWAKFAIDQLQGANGKGRLLKPKTYQRIQTAYGAKGEQSETNPHFGFGWYIQQTVRGRAGPALTHTGSDGVWIADIVLFPERGSGLLIATNAAYDMNAHTALSEASKEILSALAPPAPAAAPSAPAVAPAPH